MANKLLAVLILLASPAFARAAITVVAQDGLAPGNHGGETTAVNTTGANLIVLSLSWNKVITATPNLADSEGNSYTKLATRSSGDMCTAIYYCAAPGTDANHTWTISEANYSSPSLGVLAVSGAAAAPFDQDSGAGATQPGTLTPSEDNCLVVTSSVKEGGTLTGPGGYTWDSVGYVESNSMWGGIAYKIQTTAAAENPTWTGGSATAMAVFKAAAEAVPPTITTSASQSLEESERIVCTVEATGDEPITWSITDGDDAAFFEINSSTGVLSMPGSADYENPEDDGANNVYEVTVTATNSEGTDDLAMSVTVTDEGGSGGFFNPLQGPVR